jgi:hypothetical protein
MLNLTGENISAIANARLARLVEASLSHDMPGLVGDEPDSLDHDDIMAAVDDVRSLLRPLGLETERMVVKYVYGCLLLGEPLHDRVPNLLTALASPNMHRYEKEDALDRLIEQLLAQKEGT